MLLFSRVDIVISLSVWMVCCAAGYPALTSLLTDERGESYSPGSGGVRDRGPRARRGEVRAGQRLLVRSQAPTAIDLAC
jgi:hypothetical protein